MRDARSYWKLTQHRIPRCSQLSILELIQKFLDPFTGNATQCTNQNPISALPTVLHKMYPRLQRTFTARAAINAIIVSEIMDCTIIPAFAHRDSTAVSVGENAVLVLNARNR